MKKSILTLALVVLILIGISHVNDSLGEKTYGDTGSPEKAWADSNGSPALSSGTEDQTGIEITIYNVNLGLVKDQRTIHIAEGPGSLRFMGVASQIIPTSVSIKSLKDPASLSVVEQNYEYDLLNSQKLLDKYIGREVKLYSKNPYTEREELVTATLLSNNGGPIFRIGDEITFGHPGRVIFPGVPESLIAKPTLVWLLENRLSSGQHVEASYLTNGITWRSDYVLTLNEENDHADITGWVTIDNRSGATYQHAKLKLVAGDVNRVKEEHEYRDKMLRYAETAAMPQAQFQEDAFFEYHLYTLQRPSTIKDNQTKQISLLSANRIPVKKDLIFYGARLYYRDLHGEMISNQKIGVFVEMVNSKKHNLGMPMPKGTVRVYTHDHEGSLQFVGEDSIDHTPKDEKIRIKIGDAFDVVGTRKQTDWKKIASDTYEAAYEVSLRNHKEEDVQVRVIEPIPGDWEMLTSSHKYEKTEAFSAEFNIHVPKGKEEKLSYRVRMRF